MAECLWEGALGSVWVAGWRGLAECVSALDLALQVSIPVIDVGDWPGEVTVQPLYREASCWRSPERPGWAV